MDLCQCQRVSRASATHVGHAGTCQSEKRRPSTLTQSQEAHFDSAARGRHFALEGNGAGVANSQG